MGNRIFGPDVTRSLLFIGDTHVGGPNNPTFRWTKFADAFLADTYKPAAVIHIGDMTDQADAASVNLAKAWWSRFPAPKAQMNGDHDLLNGVTIAQWQTDYSAQEFKTVDFGFAAVITTNYVVDTARRDAIIAAANAVAPKPVFLTVHRPLRDSTGAGIAPHTNLSASAPNYSFALSPADNTNVMTAANSASNIVAVLSGHSHAWVDDPGAAMTMNMGTRTVGVINCSAITYVGTGSPLNSPLVGVWVTLKTDNKTLEVRYRDYGAGGVWTYWMGGDRAQTGRSRVVRLVTS